MGEIIIKTYDNISWEHIDMLELAFIHGECLKNENYEICGKCQAEIDRRLANDEITKFDIEYLQYSLSNVSHYNVNSNGLFNEVIKVFNL